MRGGRLLRVEALVVAAAVRAGLRLLPFARVAALAGALGPVRVPRPEDVPICVAAARCAAERVAHRTCLFESLIAFVLLRRRGHDVAFHLGARRTETFEAHAWLTVGGVCVDCARGDAFVPVWRFPQRSAS